MDKYISAKEVAALLGISKRTLLRWIQVGRVRPVRFGRTLRFSQNQLVQEIEMQEHGRPTQRDFAME
jgi:excisionase family DNA binding protein